ncbi:MAG: OmpA family protein [Verrucomicrobiota bacterium]
MERRRQVHGGISGLDKAWIPGLVLVLGACFGGPPAGRAETGVAARELISGRTLDEVKSARGSLRPKDDEGFDLYVVPVKRAMLQIVLDMAAKRKAQIVAYQFSGRVLQLDAWDGKAWLPLEEKLFRSGEFLTSRPGRLFLVGKNALPMGLVKEVSWTGEKWHVPTSTDRVLLINTLGRLHEFGRREWSWIAARYRLKLERADGAYTVVPDFTDRDADGLKDEHEIEAGTDPQDPDTDGDGLADGREVNELMTDPLSPDTDHAGLIDGVEVRNHKTDPLDEDSDDGGVGDGHEVIEDGTDPLNPEDDLQPIFLALEFDPDSRKVRRQDYERLNSMVKVLRRDPGASAVVEGHSAKVPGADPERSRRLSEQRARAVVDYLVDVGGVNPKQLTSAGFGFDRPIVPNDSRENYGKNRRVEIHVRENKPERTD